MGWPQNQIWYPQRELWKEHKATSQFRFHSIFLPFSFPFPIPCLVIEKQDINFCKFSWLACPVCVQLNINISWGGKDTPPSLCRHRPWSDFTKPFHFDPWSEKFLKGRVVVCMETAGREQLRITLCNASQHMNFLHKQQNSPQKNNNLGVQNYTERK